MALSDERTKDTDTTPEAQPFSRMRLSYGMAQALAVGITGACLLLFVLLFNLIVSGL